VRELQEYAGCKVERSVDDGYLKMTQPVLIKSLMDEFIILNNNQLITLASHGESFAIEDQHHY
jgi:hypothetical protein